MKKINKEIDLCNLPKDTRGFVDWIKSINHNIKGKYGSIEFSFRIVDYLKEETTLKLEYQDNYFYINVGNLKSCKIARILGIKTASFKINIGQQFKSEKHDIIITDRKIVEKIKKNGKKENEKWYKYTCNICGWTEGWITESNILKGVGCSCCHGKTVVENINSIVITDPWMIPYFQGGYDEAKLYTSQSGQKIYPICPDCGRVKDKSMEIHNIYKYHSMCCPSCDDKMSYPNKMMYNILYQLNIDFETEKSFNWCKYNFKNKDRIGRYDFYFRLNNVEYIIEMDGKQHKEDIKLGNWNSYHEQRYIDEQKELLAREHCIHVIRIDCEKSELNFIKKNILNSRLNNILNLSMVDWISAEEFACDNLIKIICMYKNNNPNLHCTDIGRLFKLDRSTIRKYFKKGQIHGWCEYNPNDYTNNEKRQNKTA